MCVCVCVCVYVLMTNKLKTNQLKYLLIPVILILLEESQLFF